MNTSPIGQIGAIQGHRSALRQMTTQQLLQLGRHQVAYLRSGVHDGELLFVICGADGELLALADTFDTAAEMAAECGLAFVSVH